MPMVTLASNGMGLQIPSERCKSTWVYTFCFDMRADDVLGTNEIYSDLAKQAMRVRSP